MPGARFLFTIIGIVGAVACRAAPPEGVFACQETSDCPPGQRCEDGLCWKHLASTSAQSGANEPNAGAAAQEPRPQMPAEPSGADMPPSGGAPADSGGTAGRPGTGMGAAGRAPVGGAGSGAGAGAGGAMTAGISMPAAGAGAGGTAAMPPTAAAGGGASGTQSDPSGQTPSDASCLDGIDTYFEAGPFEHTKMRMDSINFWRPMVPAGCKVPVVHLANGTGAACSTYEESLQRIASHGFLASCYESPNTGAGAQGLMSFEAALAMFPDLAAMKLGATGQNQGGQAAFLTVQLAEDKWGDEAKYAGLAVQPASGSGNAPPGGWQPPYAEITSPMLMFSGKGTDGLVSQSWVQQAFTALNDTVEAYHWTKQGVTHVPVPNAELMQLSIAWFRWKLLDDQKACAAFKAIPTMDSTWEEVAVQNAAPCK